jgi:hypothetical protein
MTDYDQTNTGAVFFEKEVKSERHPNLTGKLNVEGKEYRVAMWEKTSRSGDQFYSIAISEPREQREAVSDTKPSLKEQWVQTKAKKDEVHDVTDDEINLSDIPF